MRSLSSLVLLAAAGCGEVVGATDAGGEAGPRPDANLTCPDYCGFIAATCQDAYMQYFDLETCLATCEVLPSGTLADHGGNTLGCRLYHTNLAVLDAETHCPHAGPSGGVVCGRLCESFCAVALQVCASTPSAYATPEECATECAGFPAAQPYSANITSGDSFACRMSYLQKAASEPYVYCVHIRETSLPCSP